MSKKERATVNAGILAAGTFVEFLLSYVFIVFLARRLGPQGLGQYYYIIALISTLGLVCLLNSNDFLIKEIAKRTVMLPHILGRYVIIRMAMIVLCVLAIAVLAGYSARDNPFRLALFIGAFYSINLIMGGLLETIARGYEVILPLTLARLTERGVALVLLLVLIFLFDVSIVQAIGIIVIASIAQLICLGMMLRKYLHFSLDLSLQPYVNLFKDSLPYIAGSLFGLVYYRTDILMLGWLTSDKAVGYYAAAHQLYQILFVTVSILITVIYPPLVKLFKTKSKAFEEAAHDLVKIFLVYGFGVAFGLFAICHRLIPFVYGDQMTPSVWVLKASHLRCR